MISLTPKIQKAIIRATKLHWNQVRKGDGLPYIIHPYSVAFIVSRFSDDEDTVAAAFLHDVLEDIKKENYSHQEMIDAYRQQGAKLFSKFNSPPDKKLWFYGEVLQILKKRLKNKIVKELEKIFAEAAHIFKLDLA